MKFPSFVARLAAAAVLAFVALPGFAHDAPSAGDAGQPAMTLASLDGSVVAFDGSASPVGGVVNPLDETASRQRRNSCQSNCIREYRFCTGPRGFDPIGLCSFQYQMCSASCN